MNVPEPALTSRPTMPTMRKTVATTSKATRKYGIIMLPTRYAHLGMSDAAPGPIALSSSTPTEAFAAGADTHIPHPGHASSREGTRRWISGGPRLRRRTTRQILNGRAGWHPPPGLVHTAVLE